MYTVRICRNELTKHIHDGYTLKFLLGKSMLVYVITWNLRPVGQRNKSGPELYSKSFPEVVDNSMASTVHANSARPIIFGLLLLVGA
jgi:hypothetical protein